MIAYQYEVEESGKFFRCFSTQFPAISGYGGTEQEALCDFIQRQRDEMNQMIRKGERFPAPLKSDDASVSRIYTNATMALTMYLHTAMLDKGVSRSELANMLALGPEVADEDWHLEKIRTIKPTANHPKHKQVQRLLDVNHNSTIREMSEAFRVLDYDIGFAITPKHGSELDAPLQIH